MNKRLWSLTAVLVIVLAAFGAGAQDMMDMEPMVAVSDQLSLDGMVTIDAAVSEGPGFIVIHADNGGAPWPSDWQSCDQRWHECQCISSD
jgi:hypothetical protein